MQLLEWPGTAGEVQELLRAIEHHCTCRRDGRGARVSLCSSHALLVSEPQATRRLVFARRIADRLRREEDCQT